MASASKTPNLNLPQWVGTEKPERTDFNAAFDAIDTTVASHLADYNAQHKIKYLISAGSDIIPFTKVVDIGNNTLETLTDGVNANGRIRMYIYDNTQPAILTYATANKIDVTNIDKIAIEWEINAPSIPASPRPRIGLHDSQNDDYLTYVARMGYSEANIDRRIDKMDVSGLSGEYYFIIHCAENSAGATETEILVYNVWTESYGT